MARVHLQNLVEESNKMDTHSTHIYMGAQCRSLESAR